MTPETTTTTAPARRRSRWKAVLAYLFVLLVVLTILFNLVSDGLVSRYERNAPRETGTPYLQGMAPRTLGPADAPGAVLFVHGFIGAPSNFAKLPERVAEAGWRVRVMTLPGHGTSPRDFERTTADELIAGVRDELRALKADHDRVVLVGHSMGGALSTIVAAEDPVDGLILCAPYFGLTWGTVLGVPVERLIPSAATVVRWVPRGPGGRPVRLKANRPFVDAYEWMPTQSALTALEIGARANPAETGPKITAPLLLLHARGDTITSPDASAAAFPLFASARKELIWLEASDHVVFWDYDAQIVEDAVLGHLKEVSDHAPDQPSIRE